MVSVQLIIPTWFLVQKSGANEPVCGEANDPVGKQVISDKPAKAPMRQSRLLHD
jgi:hypothetical protein